MARSDANDVSSHRRLRGKRDTEGLALLTYRLHPTAVRGTTFMEKLDGFHSGLILAARITLAHFSVSSAMSLPKSAGEPISAMPSSSASFALILGSARPALISLLSFLMISAGVFLVAPKP